MGKSATQTLTNVENSVPVQQTVNWPSSQSLNEHSMRIAVFDHRQCGGTSATIDAAQKYINAHGGYCCVFLSFKPTHSREDKITKDKHRGDIVKALANKFVDAAEYPRYSLVLIDLSMIAIIRVQRGNGDALISTITKLDESKMAPASEKFNQILKTQMQKPMDLIISCVKLYFQHMGGIHNCYGHLFQSKETAICTIAVTGGTLQDVEHIRMIVRFMLPKSTFPLIVAHTTKNKDGHVYMSVAGVTSDTGYGWVAHAPEGIIDLAVHTGEPFIKTKPTTHWNVKSGFSKNNITKYRDPSHLYQQKEQSVEPSQLQSKQKSSSVTAWSNIVMKMTVNFFDSLTQNAKAETLRIREEKITEAIAIANANAARQRTTGREAKTKETIKIPTEISDTTNDQKGEFVEQSVTERPVHSKTLSNSTPAMTQSKIAYFRTKRLDDADHFLRYEKLMERETAVTKRGNNKPKNKAMGQSTAQIIENSYRISVAEQSAINIAIDIINARLKYSTVTESKHSPE